MNFIRLLTTTAIFLAAAVMAAPPAIYPTPQKSQFTGRGVRSDEIVVVVRRDAAATPNPLWKQIPENQGRTPCRSSRNA